MNKLKIATQKAVAYALITAIIIFLYTLVSSQITFHGVCLESKSCNRLTYTMQRLSITVALSWKLIALIGIFPYLLHSIKHFKDKIKGSKYEKK